MRGIFLLLVFFANFAYSSELYKRTVAGESIEIELSSAFSPQQISYLKTVLNKLFAFPCMPASKLHNHVFRGDSCGVTYLKWLRKRVHRIDLAEHEDKDVIGFYWHYESFWDQYFNKHSKTINLTFNFFDYPNKKSSPQTHFLHYLEAMSTIVHEARHVDGYSHSRCPKTYDDYTMIDRLARVTFENADKYSCDESPIGAWAAEILFKYPRLKTFRLKLNEALYLSSWITNKNARVLLSNDLMGKFEFHRFGESAGIK